MKTEIYLEIAQKGFEKLKKEAVEESKANLGDDWVDEACYKDLLMEDACFEFDADTGKLNIYGSMYKEGLDMGYISLDTEMELDLVVELVNYYMKKLGKLKTVLEATK